MFLSELKDAKLPRVSPDSINAGTLSVIVPVYNGGSAFERCLAALRESDFKDFELLVVDDCSTDGSSDVARRFGAAVFTTAARGGPGAARNLGSEHARGEIVCFVDADCAVHPDTIGRVACFFEAHPEVDAVFGSYDATPAAPGFIAQYKNLFHHYIHQKSTPEATTFWAGCGAVRRKTFLEAGGFDSDRFRRPSIEDIELGGRLVSSGKQIRLEKEIQVTHLKAWTFSSLLRADLLDRAIPWSRLLFGRRNIVADLNLRAHHRASGALAWLLVILVAAIPFFPPAAFAGGGAAALLLVLNVDLYRFFARERGLAFAIGAVPLHWFYYLYATAGFVIGVILAMRDTNRSRRGPSPLSPR